MQKSLTILFFLLVTLALPSAILAQCIAPGTVIYDFEYNGTRYEIVQENLSWVDAAACAVARGGKLAEINDQQEQDTIFYHANQAGITAANTVAPDGGGASYLWLGGNDIATEGDWIWDGANTGMGPQFWQGTTTGGPVGGLYNNWGNEPDNYLGQDGLGLAITNWPLGVAGQWNDVDETNRLYYIIEGADSTVALDPTLAPFALDIYPNPSAHSFALDIPAHVFNEASISVKIFDARGALVSELPGVPGKMKVELPNQSNGLYFVHLHNGARLIATGKLVIER